MSSSLRRIACHVVVAVIAVSSPALAAEFTVRPKGDETVVFVSQTSMAQFEGKTGKIEGRIVADPSALHGSVTVHVEVDLASLDTGINLRNRHMREKYLETGKFPKAIFDGVTIATGSPVALEARKPTTFDVEGTFTLHGVTRPLRVTIDATYADGRIAFHTEFPVTLADYGIQRPQFLALKLGETQLVRVNALAVAVP